MDDRSGVLDALGIREFPAAVRFYPILRRAIVLVSEEGALTTAQANSRSASQDTRWDIDVLSYEAFEQQVTSARRAFQELRTLDELKARTLCFNGFFEIDDVAACEPNELMQLCDVTGEQADKIIEECARISMAQFQAEAKNRQRRGREKKDE